MVFNPSVVTRIQKKDLLPLPRSRPQSQGSGTGSGSDSENDELERGRQVAWKTEDLVNPSLVNSHKIVKGQTCVECGVVYGEQLGKVLVKFRLLMRFYHEN